MVVPLAALLVDQIAAPDDLGHTQLRGFKIQAPDRHNDVENRMRVRATVPANAGTVRDALLRVPPPARIFVLVPRVGTPDMTARSVPVDPKSVQHVLFMPAGRRLDGVGNDIALGRGYLT